MDTRNVIVLQGEDAETSPDDYASFHVNVLADEEILRAYKVFAKTEADAFAIAIAQAQTLLDASLVAGGFEEGIPDATIMDKREWELDALFAEGYRPDVDLWDGGPIKRYVTVEWSHGDEHWMAFHDSVDEALRYFDQIEGPWEPQFIQDLDSDERWDVERKTFLVEKKEEPDG
jgi:hypothetical protein